jgi:Sigma-70 region 2
MNVSGEYRTSAARDLERVFGQGTATAMPDGKLLHRFVVGKDEGAFSALVSKHGPMFLGVCRRALGTRSDADDAFQVTFLVLLRRASALNETDSLGPWLYGVAWRVALRARAVSARRRLEERTHAGTRPEWSEPEILDWSVRSSPAPTCSSFAGGSRVIGRLNANPVIRKEDPLARVFPRHVALDAARFRRHGTRRCGFGRALRDRPAGACMACHASVVVSRAIG